MRPSSSRSAFVLRLAVAALFASLGAQAARAGPLYGSIGWTTSLEFGGLSTQPPGALVTIDPGALGPADSPAGYSMTPGGTTLVADTYGTGDDGYLLGLDFDGGGNLFASTCDTDYCPEGSSMLLQLDPDTGAATPVGAITDGSDPLDIYDLAFQPGTDVLYGISDFLGTSCAGCLYTIDTTTAQATLVADLGYFTSGGLAFAPDGTLYFSTVYPTVGSNLDLYVLDPTTGAVLSREDVLLEQQFLFHGVTITSAPLQGLAVDESGVLHAVGDNGITLLYERVFDTVKDVNGTPTGAPTWVWRVVGDAGENITDLAFQPVPEPSSGALLLLAAAFALRLRRGPGEGGATAS